MLQLHKRMVKKLLFAILFLYSTFTHAETIKTDVLVIGGTASGVAAAIQSARSKVKTILIVPGTSLVNMPAGNNYTIQSHRNLPSGIWGEFRNRVQEFYKTTAGYDTTYNATLKFESFTGSAILKAIADTVKGLTIKTNTPFNAIKKDGTGWEVSITINGKTDVIKAKVVVDATDGGDVVTKLGLTFPPVISYRDDGASKLYRTSIAVGENTFVPISALIIKDADNLLITQKALPVNADIQQLPMQLITGQGTACIAAYCAFFKTTTKNLKPRIIQQELLDYKGHLLPFEDVKANDRYIRAVQQIGATGLLKGVKRTNAEGIQFNFLPAGDVTTAEIQPVLNEIYSRAFIWFDKEKPGEKFSIGNTLSLISEFILTDPKTLQTNLQKDWQTLYKFAKPYDITRPITRLEFAVLVNKFLNPFARKIDLEGNMVN